MKQVEVALSIEDKQCLAKCFEWELRKRIRKKYKEFDLNKLKGKYINQGTAFTHFFDEYFILELKHRRGEWNILERRLMEKAKKQYKKYWNVKRAGKIDNIDDYLKKYAK